MSSSNRNSDSATEGFSRLRWGWKMAQTAPKCLFFVVGIQECILCGIDAISRTFLKDISISNVSKFDIRDKEVAIYVRVSPFNDFLSKNYEFAQMHERLMQLLF